MRTKHAIRLGMFLGYTLSVYLNSTVGRTKMFVCLYAGVHRHGDHAVPGAERHGGADRAPGPRLRALCALQQRERTAFARLQREDGPGERLELPHIPVQRRRPVRQLT